MQTIAFVRGAFLNNFEGQNFLLNPKKFSLHAFSSSHPIHTQFSFPVTRLPSISNLDEVPIFNNFGLYHKAVKYLSNRSLGDSQILFGLEDHVKKFDVVDTADPFYFYSYQLARLRQKNLIKKLFITYCETIPHNNESVARKKFIKYFSMSQADRFICHTELSKKSLVIEGADASKIDIIRLGVDLNRFKKIDRKKSSDLTILFAGRLVPEKGVLDLYSAFCELKKSPKYRNVMLRIVGAGSLRKDLERRMKADGVEKSIRIEEKRYEEMPEVYQEADVFVLPSKRTKTWEEQYGMVLIEAMASGLPVISTESGAIPEVVGNAGGLVRESCVEDLLHAIQRVLDSADLRKRMSEKSFDRAEQLFDCRKTAELIGTIYSR